MHLRRSESPGQTGRSPAPKARDRAEGQDGQEVERVEHGRLEAGGGARRPAHPRGGRPSAGRVAAGARSRAPERLRCPARTPPRGAAAPARIGPRAASGRRAPSLARHAAPLPMSATDPRASAVDGWRGPALPSRLLRGGSSVGRASRSQCEGRGFEPLPLHHLQGLGPCPGLLSCPRVSLRPPGRPPPCLMSRGPRPCRKVTGPEASIRRGNAAPCAAAGRLPVLGGQGLRVAGRRRPAGTRSSGRRAHARASPSAAGHRLPAA